MKNVVKDCPSNLQKYGGIHIMGSELQVMG